MSTFRCDWFNKTERNSCTFSNQELADRHALDMNAWGYSTKSYTDKGNISKSYGISANLGGEKFYAAIPACYCNIGERVISYWRYIRSEDTPNRYASIDDALTASDNGGYGGTWVAVVNEDWEVLEIAHER